MKKRSHRSRKRRKPISQHLAEGQLKESNEKVFADQKKHSGEVTRKKKQEVAGGEGEKEKWWKAITVSKRSTSQTTPIIESDNDNS